MEIRTIKNGWLVNVRDGGRYLGDSCNISEVFFATKDELLAFLGEKLLTAEQIEQKEEERRRAYEAEKAQIGSLPVGRFGLTPNIQA